MFLLEAIELSLMNFLAAVVAVLAATPASVAGATAGAGAPVAPHVPVATAASSDGFDDLYFAPNAEGVEAGPIDSATAKFLRSIKEPSMRAVISGFDFGLFFSRHGESSTMSHFFATFFEGLVYEGYPFDEAVAERIYKTFLQGLVSVCVKAPIACPSGPLAAYPRTELAQAIFLKFLLGGPFKTDWKQLMLDSYVGHSVVPPLTDRDLMDLPEAKLADVYAAVARASSRGATGGDRITAAFDLPVWKYLANHLLGMSDQVSELDAIAFKHKKSRESGLPALDEDLIQQVDQSLRFHNEEVNVIACKYRFHNILRRCASTPLTAGPDCDLPAHLTHPFDAAMFLRFVIAPADSRKGGANYLLGIAGAPTAPPLSMEDLRTIAATPFGDILRHVRAGETARASSLIAYAIDRILH